MKIQIFYNSHYLPFNLYINSIFHIFKHNKYFFDNNCNVSIINDLDLYTKQTDYLILFINDIRYLYFIETFNTKIICICADPTWNFTKKEYKTIFDYYNIINPQNTYIWDFTIINMDHFKKNNFINNKIYHIPIIYNDYLEQIYLPHKKNIPFSERQIDVLFLGTVNTLDPNDNRFKLLKKVHSKYKTVICNGIQDIQQYINYIENSKIILHIVGHKDNIGFDYYRLALLHSNKVFCIQEKHKLQDSIIKYLDNDMIMTDYDNLLNTIDIHINKSDLEINYIVDKIYNRFKSKKMDDLMIEFFKNVNK